MNMDQFTKNATHETQIDRQVEKKSYTHDTNSYRQANREGIGGGETKAITHGFKILFLRSFVTCYKRGTA